MRVWGASIVDQRNRRRRLRLEQDETPARTLHRKIDVRAVHKQVSALSTRATGHL
jgi:hypothetical protein